VLPVPMDLLVQQASQDSLVIAVRMAFQVLPVPLAQTDNQEVLVRRVHGVKMEKRGLQVLKDRLALKVQLEILVRLENLDSSETLDHLDQLGHQDLVDRQVLLDQ